MIAALFVRRDSIYKTLEGVDAWDADRNALNWPGGCRVICHPPCRFWGTLRNMPNVIAGTPPEDREQERQLALWALDQCDRWGGILEHPRGSSFWKHTKDRPGFLHTMDQVHFGHVCKKPTTLYISGIRGKDLPPVPIMKALPSRVISGPAGVVPTKAEREHTPPAFAKWLVEALQ